MFCEEMIEFFHKIPVALRKPVGRIKKQQMLLIDIGGKWSMDKHKSKNPPLKGPIISKEAHKKE